MSFFEFPRTRTYDSDLGWLIDSMRDLIDEYNEILSKTNSNTANINELASRVRTLENSWSTLQREFEALEDHINEYVFSLVNTYFREVNVKISVLEENILALSNLLVKEKRDLVSLIEATDDANRSWTMAEIQRIIDNLPSYLSILVYNPVKGAITDINECIMDLYELSRNEALTAIEYDMLDLTASEYDSLNLTAREYDEWAKKLLYKNPLWYMPDPFTGASVPVKQVVSELADLHRAYALTASNYDALSLDASYYDNLSITAYDYDFHGATLVH